MTTRIAKLAARGQAFKARIEKFGAPYGNKNAAGPHDGSGIDVKGDMLQLGGGSVSSVDKDSWIVFDGKDAGKPTQIKLTKHSNGNFLLDIDNKSDLQVKSLKEAVSFLNKYKASFAGVEDRSS